MRVTMLSAGAGRAAIELPGELFPIEGLTGVHDVLHARVLLLDCERRIALVSMELTSLPEERIALLREAVGESAGLPPENVWICATHTMSAPHFVPEKMCKSPADGQKNGLLWQAVLTAVRNASLEACARLTPAHVGHGSGPCDVNVNRDVLTADGWWLGRNEMGFSDKTLTVLRFETPAGNPIALLFSHAVRSAVTERPPGSDEAALVTADLAGAASTFVEQEFGDGVIAPFFMGAAGDQAPALTGAESQCDDGDRRLAVAETIGSRLGAEVVRLAREIECGPFAGSIQIEREAGEYPGQQTIDTRLIRPTKEYAFVASEPRSEKVEVIRMGDMALVGVRPELSCAVGAHIRERSPLPATLVVTMVNGAAKYMADESSYERMTYEAMNSPFASGSAELLAERALDLLLRVAGS